MNEDPLSFGTWRVHTDPQEAEGEATPGKVHDVGVQPKEYVVITSISSVTCPGSDDNQQLSEDCVLFVTYPW